jgi:hypothetical protein
VSRHCNRKYLALPGFVLVAHRCSLLLRLRRRRITRRSNLFARDSSLKGSFELRRGHLVSDRSEDKRHRIRIEIVHGGVRALLVDLNLEVEVKPVGGNALTVEAHVHVSVSRTTTDKGTIELAVGNVVDPPHNLLLQAWAASHLDEQVPDW